MKLVIHLREEWRLFLVAVQFLTRLPTPDWPQFSCIWLNQCVRYFPLVGGLVGGVGGVVLTACLFIWPEADTHYLLAIIVTVSTVIVTGAFHEDGLADTLDALGGQVSRERALDIMKDSRIGTYGACALMLTLLLRIILLASVLQHSLVLAYFGLMVSHILGRTVAVCVMASLPYAGDAAHAKAKPLATSVQRPTFIAASLVSLGLLCMLHALAMTYQPTFPLLFFWGACGVSLWMLWWYFRRWIQRRIGGYTGDTLGASEQLAEIVVWLCLYSIILHQLSLGR